MFRLVIALILTISPAGWAVPNCIRVLSGGDAEWVSLSLTNARAVMKKAVGEKGKPLYETEHFARYEVPGLPQGVKMLDPSTISQRIFRYYFQGERNRLGEVLKNERLRAGPAPYAIVSPGVQVDYYVDLTGVFVTTPKFKAEQVGLTRADNATYVDFRFPEGTGVLQIEPGILLVPGNKGNHAWVRQAYEEFKKSGRLPRDSSIADLVLKMQDEERRNPSLLIPMQIPIQIVRSKGKVERP
jgi:hypothetical protein